MDMPFERPRLPSAGLQCRLPQALWCEPISEGIKVVFLSAFRYKLSNYFSNLMKSLRVLKIDYILCFITEFKI